MNAHRTTLTTVIALSIALGAGAAPTLATDNDRGNPKACTATTKAAYSACLFSGLDSYWIANGKCRNEKEDSGRRECMAEARATLQEDNALCREQREARDDLCDELGEAPYDPRFETEDFVNPLDIGRSVAPNPWFPLIKGRTLVYQAGTEIIRVSISDRVKVIDNIPCLVVRDVVEIDGQLIEDTIDWFAQDIHGNVWYCGEATAEYEEGFPVNVDGSFQADVDGARPGMIMKAAPAVGDVYRQEFDLGNAEDAAKVINLHGSATSPVASCASTCLVTEESTPISPGAIEHKYYKAGIGKILQIDPATGERLELIEIIDR
jgi:hypothetical protein